MKVNTYPTQGDWQDADDTEGCWACNAAHAFVDFEHNPNFDAVILQNDAGELREVTWHGRLLGGLDLYTCRPMTAAEADVRLASAAS